MSEDTVTIDLTGECILNPSALPPWLEGWMRYRIEYYIPGQTYPDELGYIYLPPEADVVDVINVLNGKEVYIDSQVARERDEWLKAFQAAANDRDRLYSENRRLERERDDAVDVQKELMKQGRSILTENRLLWGAYQGQYDVDISQVPLTAAEVERVARLERIEKAAKNEMRACPDDANVLITYSGCIDEGCTRCPVVAALAEGSGDE